MEVTHKDNLYEQFEGSSDGHFTMGTFLAVKDGILNTLSTHMGQKETQAIVDSINKVVVGTRPKNFSELNEKEVLLYVIEEKSAAELAFRQFLEGELKASRHIEKGKLGKIIDLTIACSKQDITEYNLVFLLFEDLFEGQTIKECEKIFDIVEARVDILQEPAFFTKGKLPLLRSCVHVLKRLSRAVNTVFCGRILMFLASAFPLSDRSGLNIPGNFHTDNVTLYEEEEGEEEGGKTNGEAKGVQLNEEKRTETDTPTDMELYRTFWGLQTFLQNPNELYFLEKYGKFAKGAEAVLAAFAAYGAGKDDDDSNSMERFVSESAAMDGSLTADEIESFYCAKFLTSSRLMNLQLRDPSFRRHILVQLLITFQHLRHNEPVKLRPGQKALTAKQQSWIEEKEHAVFVLLERTPPAGKVFTKAIRAILGREQNWIRWKKDACPVYEKPPLEGSFEGENKSKKRAAVYAHHDMDKRIRFNNKELERLWSLGTDREKELSAEISTIPSVEDFLEPIKMELDPEECIEAEYRKSNNKIYCWKALRLISKSHMDMFKHIVDSKEKNPLEAIVTSMTKTNDGTMDIDGKEDGPGEGAEDVKDEEVREEKEEGDENEKEEGEEVEEGEEGEEGEAGEVADAPTAMEVDNKDDTDDKEEGEA